MNMLLQVLRRSSTDPLEQYPTGTSFSFSNSLIYGRQYFQCVFEDLYEVACRLSLLPRAGCSTGCFCYHLTNHGLALMALQAVGGGKVAMSNSLVLYKRGRKCENAGKHVIAKARA